MKLNKSSSCLYTIICSFFCFSLLSCAADLDNLDKFKNPNTEDPNTEDPNTEDPNTEDPNTEDPNTEDPNTEDPNTEDPNTEDPNTEDPDEPTLEEQCAEGGEFANGAAWYANKCSTCHESAPIAPAFAPGGVIDTSGTVVASCGNGEKYADIANPENGFIYRLIMERGWESGSEFECTDFGAMVNLFEEFFVTDPDLAASRKACLLDLLTP